MWASHKAGAPELDTVSLSAGIGFVADAVDGDEREAVSHRVTSLHELPGLALTRLFLGRVAALVAYSRWIDEDIGTSKSHQAGTFGIPLIPADLYAEVAHRGFDRMETEVARGEVELLVVGRIIGDVHLAMDAGYAAIAFEDNGSVVVKPRCTTLEETGDEDDIVLGCKRAEEVSGRTWNGFGKVEIIDRFHLTKIGRVVEFLKHNELCTTRCDVGYGSSKAGAVIFC